MSRRECLGALVGAGAVIAGSNRKAVAVEQIPAPPVQTLGKSGIRMSRMGFGTGVNSSRKRSRGTDLGFEKFVGLFQHAYERGITFFDLADSYGSHIYMREALRSIPREKVTLLTKVWWPYDSKTPAALPTGQRYRSMHKAFRRYQEELGTETIDIVLLHCLREREWVPGMQPYMDALSELKEQGKIRALGVSCHDWGAMETAVDQPWVDVMLTRLNPGGLKMDNTPEKVVELMQRARAKEIGVIGMKIYGEGDLLSRKDECMRYAQTNGVLDAMTIGALSEAEIDENVTLMGRYPVTK